MSRRVGKRVFAAFPDFSLSLPVHVSAFPVPLGFFLVHVSVLYTRHCPQVCLFYVFLLLPFFSTLLFPSPFDSSCCCSCATTRFISLLALSSYLICGFVNDVFKFKDNSNLHFIFSFSFLFLSQAYHSVSSFSPRHYSSLIPQLLPHPLVIVRLPTYPSFLHSYSFSLSISFTFLRPLYTPCTAYTPPKPKLT